MRKIYAVTAVLLLCAAFAVYADCSTLTFISEAVPQLTVGQTVHFDFDVDGGQAPYHFALVSGDLPPGVHLTNSGGLRGKPTAVADTTAFITVTDANGCTLTQAFAVRADL
jgi:Putative Ig domain